MNSGPPDKRAKKSKSDTHRKAEEASDSEVTETSDAPQQRHGKTSNTENACAGESTSDHEDILSEEPPPVRPAHQGKYYGLLRSHPRTADSKAGDL